MATEEEKVSYKITKADGSSGSSSEDYTGTAEVEYPNKDTYSGDFKNGLKEGSGTYTFNNGDKYIGQFKNNLQHGIGKTEYAKGGKYNGRYENGTRHGEGVYVYANGDIYSGSWKNGKKHGKGTYIVNNCKLEGNNYMKVAGEWINGDITEGKWIFPNKTYYEGIFEKNMPKNKGKWVFANGDNVLGRYFHSQANIDSLSDELGTKLTWNTDEEVFDPNKHFISS